MFGLDNVKVEGEKDVIVLSDKIAEITYDNVIIIDMVRSKGPA